MTIPNDKLLEEQFNKYTDQQLHEAIRELYAELARRKRIGRRDESGKYKA